MNRAGRATAPATKHERVCTVADSQAKVAWDKLHTTKVLLKLNNNTDAEIISKLATVPSKQGYIKELIKADISQK